MRFSDRPNECEHPDALNVDGTVSPRTFSPAEGMSQVTPVGAEAPSRGARNIIGASALGDEVPELAPASEVKAPEERPELAAQSEGEQPNPWPGGKVRVVTCTHRPEYMSRIGKEAGKSEVVMAELVGLSPQERASTTFLTNKYLTTDQTDDTKALRKQLMDGRVSDHTGMIEALPRSVRRFEFIDSPEGSAGYDANLEVTRTGKQAAMAIASAAPNRLITESVLADYRQLATSIRTRDPTTTTDITDVIDDLGDAYSSASVVIGFDHQEVVHSLIAAKYDVDVCFVGPLDPIDISRPYVSYESRVTEMYRQDPDAEIPASLAAAATLDRIVRTYYPDNMTEVSMYVSLASAEEVNRLLSEMEELKTSPAGASVQESYMAAGVALHDWVRSAVSLHGEKVQARCRGGTVDINYMFKASDPK